MPVLPVDVVGGLPSVGPGVVGMHDVVGPVACVEQFAGFVAVIVDHIDTYDILVAESGVIHPCGDVSGNADKSG